MEKLIYEKESYQINGACFEVYKNMGSGFLEAVYQECLELEMKQQNIPFIPQQELELKYKNEMLLYRPSASTGVMRLYLRLKPLISWLTSIGPRLLITCMPPASNWDYWSISVITRSWNMKGSSYDKIK